MTPAPATTPASSWIDSFLSWSDTERLAYLCEQAGADEYVSGPSARAYIDERVFAERGIRLTWFDYGPYPEYPQLWGEFVHEVSILDLLFNCGTKATDYMRQARP